ncbi:MAG TPA: acyl-CoA dehydrogenase family protein [Marmoricola sp.]|jgi:alkylation response protein AidB-like acyl-CoA dehydrogenase|nr:acyl-CoA dehydrogenase family protein [Marmoricola sp.]
MDLSSAAPFLDEQEREILKLVDEFVDDYVVPRVRDYEADDIYPEDFIERMKQLGFFGLLIPSEFGGIGVSTSCFALVTESLARGWMSLAGAIGGHSVMSFLLREFGTREQQERFLPGMADGSLRVTMALTEPSGGSDLQAMRTQATYDSERDAYVVRGQKTWISNARRSERVAVLCKTDPAADPAYRGMSVLLVPRQEAVTVSGNLPKLGYKGVEACEISFDDALVPAADVVGGEPGAGWRQMMRSLEVGRIQVAARAVGVAQASLDAAVTYGQQRETFGKPIWQHQAVGNRIADMATKVRAARLLVLDAARLLDTGQRVDMEAGMAKLFASEVAAAASFDAMRVHGAYGYSREYDVERYYRDAPLMVIGEGTNEIQQGVIARQLIQRSQERVARGGRR